MSVTNVVSSADKTWSGETGRINKDLLSKLITTSDSMWFGICGPPGFNREAVKIVQEKFSINNKNIHVFEG